ncbi:hypothetical protein NKH77_23280 [Streptomyces sp. M19]
MLVGLALKAGQYPSDLKAGDTVAAYGVGTPTTRRPVRRTRRAATRWCRGRG